MDFTKILPWKRNERRNNASSIVGLKGFASEVSPVQGYHFYSDFFKLDDCYGTIMTFFHGKGADRGAQSLPRMWGVNLLPQNLGNNISAHLLVGIKAMSPKWVSKHLDKMDSVNASANGEASNSNHTKQRLLATYRTRDVQIINKDINNNGDSYLSVDFKILLKADTLEHLEHAIKTLSRTYDFYFGKMYMHAFDGEQYQDISNLLKPPTEQLGKNYMLTGSEFAGSYNLVSQGINDDYGDYCGTTDGDINNSAVIWDIENFHNHVIIAADQPAETRGAVLVGDRHYPFPPNTRGATMWGAKLAQDAIFNNHRVIHLVLNNAKIDKICKDFDDITTRVPMNQGAINPFEIFGNYKHQLSAFPAHIQKLALMAKQVTPSLNDVDLGKYFRDVVDAFYRDKGMWYENAPSNQNRLRIINLPHWQYPRLRDFSIYLGTALTIAQNRGKRGDQRMCDAIERLQASFGNRMENENADLFDQYTQRSVDIASSQIQVIYDFSDLMNRDPSITMAQFVNALGYATHNLHRGDLIEIHGAEDIDGNVHQRYSVKRYTTQLLRRLHHRGVRVAYLYDSIDQMLDDTEFNGFDDADWVLTGHMDTNDIQKYQDRLNRSLPDSLVEEISSRKSPYFYYLRRGVDNVPFIASPVINYPHDKLGRPNYRLIG